MVEVFDFRRTGSRRAAAAVFNENYSIFDETIRRNHSKYKSLTLITLSTMSVPPLAKVELLIVIARSNVCFFQAERINFGRGLTQCLSSVSIDFELC